MRCQPQFYIYCNMLPNIPQFLAMPGYIEVPLALPQALSTSSCYIIG